MTYREKLQKEHPGCINEYSLGGCDGCPYEYEYEKKKEEICEVSDEKCRKCWDREIPGTEEKKQMCIRDRFPLRIMDTLVYQFPYHI